MYKIFKDNMLWLALMSVIQNYHLPKCLKEGDMLLDTVNICVSSCQELYHSLFFFTASAFENDLNFGQFQSQ